MTWNGSTHSGETRVLTRRALLDRGVRLAVLGTMAACVGAVSPLASAAPPVQDNWRRCSKCNELFFNGYRDKGLCPAGGGHAVFGRFDYVLTYDDSTGPGQGDWRFCTRCKALFFNGYPAKGVCPGNPAGHDAAGYNFFLFHDRAPRGNEEGAWRYCSRCQVLFYNADPDRSACRAGGRHAAAGYRFVLALRGGNID